MSAAEASSYAAHSSKIGWIFNPTNPGYMLEHRRRHAYFARRIMRLLFYTLGGIGVREVNPANCIFLRPLGVLDTTKYWRVRSSAGQVSKLIFNIA